MSNWSASHALSSAELRTWTSPDLDLCPGPDLELSIPDLALGLGPDLALDNSGPSQNLLDLEISLVPNLDWPDLGLELIQL